ncbi:MAG: hypothetical protein ACP5MJ_13330, partial [Roseiflexus sp.]
LYTRHPWIAERSLSLLCGARLPEEDDLYADLFRALGDYLGKHPHDEERKLLSKLPLAFKYCGDFKRARQLFQRAAAAVGRDSGAGATREGDGTSDGGGHADRA